MPLLAAIGVQVPPANGVGPVVIGAGHVVVIHSDAVGPDGTQEATGTFEVLFVEQLVVIHGNAAGVTGVQDETGVGPVVTGAGQVVSVQLFPAAAGVGVHEDTATFVVLFAVQSVAV